MNAHFSRDLGGWRTGFKLPQRDRDGFGRVSFSQGKNLRSWVVVLAGENGSRWSSFFHPGQVPDINTQRLSLSVLNSEYAQICTDYALRNRDHHAAPAPSRSDEYYRAEYWGERLINAQKRFEEGTSIEMFLLARESPRRIIGNCGFDGFSFGAFQACYLGYNLDKDEVGNGYMTEALDAAISYAFDLTGIHRIMANYMPTNARGGNVLKRLGFRVEGYARNYLRLNGAWQDHVLTAMHSDEWNCRSNAPRPRR